MVTPGKKLKPVFLCDPCGFETNKKNAYDIHLLTRKHKNGYISAGNGYICPCGKTYKYRQGLYRHKINCSDAIPALDGYKIQSVDCEGYTKSLYATPLICTSCQGVYQTLSGLHKHQSKCIDQQQNMLKLKIIDSLQEQNSVLLKQIVPAGCIQNINSHNKTFNLQIFLNEDCKDAMNMSDFINSVTLQLSDLESVGELGYIEGISNIFLQKLNAMDVYKRPIHCTDIKRHTMHIKDQDQWQRDDEYRLFKQAIKRMSKKNSDLLLDWKSEQSSSHHDKDQEKYMLLIIQSMGGGSDVNMDDSEVKIIKRIAKCIVLDKTI